MASGDIKNPKRPRYEANERFDTVDAEAASASPRDHDTAISRAVLVTPKAASASPTGMIISGFGVSLNPTGPTDGKIRILAAAGVALDSDGNTLIKPAATEIDVTIPSGTHQVYIYFAETATDTANRRKISVTAPYTESSDAMETTYQGTIGAHVRSGALASTVADDVVNGRTTPLCLICIATNAGGVGTITITGWNATTAPNGTEITNRLSTVAAPATAPTLNTRSGSPSTIHDIITALGYTIGNATFKGSALLTPAASNNFGAYSVPTLGVQAVGEDFTVHQLLLLEKILERLTPGPGSSTQEQGGERQWTAREGADIPLNEWAYTLHGGQAYPRQGTANNKVQIAPGTLFQKIAASNGSTPTFLPYAFVGTEEVTIANGDGTNPRVDLVQMQLTWNATTRRVECALTVKQGAPAASPVYPTPDAGHVPIAAVVVPTSFAWGSGLVFVDHATSPVLHDQRIPMGVPRMYRVFPGGGECFFPSAGWTMVGANLYFQATASAYAATVACPTGKIGRLLAFQVSGCGMVGSRFSRREVTNNVGVVSTYLNGNDAEVAVGTLSALNTLTSDRKYIESDHRPNTGPTVLPSVASPYHGAPVWTNGKRVAVVEGDGAVYATTASLSWIVPNTGVVINDALFFGASWFLAEGI